MIKIYSGWTNQGGSTVAFINLTNALNEAGHETIFYGPHTWHLGKCKSERVTEKLQLDKDDTLIVHFTTKIQSRPPIKKVIFSSHEQNLFNINSINYKVFDKIHFVSEHQKQYHNLNHPSFIIPNIVDDLKANNKPQGKIVGIIGSIDRNKQVHISIQRALKDGCDQILIFGLITDLMYWQLEVEPLIDGNRVKYMEYCEDKQQMYDMITDVYHSSLMESWGYIKAECELTNTMFHSNNTSFESKIINKNDIINIWLKELNLI